MVRFQKLTRNLFLTLHGHNVHRQQRQLSKFLMRYQRFASHAYCGTAGLVSKAAPRSRSRHEKRTAGSAWETWTVAAADGVCCASLRWETNLLLTFETAPFFCVYPVFRTSTSRTFETEGSVCFTILWVSHFEMKNPPLRAVPMLLFTNILANSSVKNK